MKSLKCPLDLSRVRWKLLLTYTHIQYIHTLAFTHHPGPAKASCGDSEFHPSASIFLSNLIHHFSISYSGLSFQGSPAEALWRIHQLFMSCFLATRTKVPESTRSSAVMYRCDKKNSSHSGLGPIPAHLHQPQCDICTESHRKWQLYSAAPCSCMASGPSRLTTQQQPERRVWWLVVRLTGP